MAIIKYVFLSVVLFVIFMLSGREVGFGGGYYDWGCLFVFALLPLLSRETRRLSVLSLVLVVVVNSMAMFLLTFYILASLYGEAL